MPSPTKISVSRRAFAENLLPFLGDIDMEFTTDKIDGITPKLDVIEKNGKFYDFRVVYFTHFVEVRVYVDDYDPNKGRYTPGVHENCYVYLNYPTPFRSSDHTGSIIIDKYYIQGYKKYKRHKNKCFYCDSHHNSSHFKTHDRCAKHMTNKEAVVTDLAKAARLPEDCMRHILSYLY